MLKQKSKIIALLLILLLVVSTVSFATDTPVATSETGNVVSTVPGDNARVEGDETSTNNAAETPEIHNGDLYVFDNNIEMDKLVDGNVFLFGNNINVTGKVNGSLYAFGKNVTFSKDAYIIQAIYVMADEVTLNGIATDLYAFARKLDMSFDSFMYRDLRVFAETFNFNGGVGRNAFVEADNFNFVTNEDAPALVYGDLTYSSSKELSLTTSHVQGNINYKQELIEEESITSIILEKVIDVCNTLLYVFVVFLLCLWLAPKFLSKSSSYIAPASATKSFGIGLLSVIVASVVGIALLFTVVGVPVGLAVIALLVLLLSIATAVTSISITYKLKEKFGFAKNYLTYLTLACVVIVIWALGLIPYVGAVISFVVKMIGLGIVVYYLFTRNSDKKDVGKPEKTAKVEKKEKPEKAEKSEKKEKSSKKDTKKKED